MSGTVTTTVTELPESRVRVAAQVPADEVEKRLEQAARALGRDLRIPGFRKGKVPAAVVIGRVGRETVLDEAVRSALGGWYAQAIDAAGISPVGDPEVELGDLPEPGGELTFTVEIGVRPGAKLGTYKGVKVTRRAPEVEDAAIDAEIDGLRERFAKLETVERGSADGDFVVIDFVGSIDGEVFAGGEGRDQLLELGSQRFIPGFEEQLVGATAGEERTVRVTFPDDYGAPHLAGKDAEFAVTVKEVKEKRLPELDDDFALEAAGLDSLAELRDEVRGRISHEQEHAIEQEFREAVLDAVVDDAKLELPDALVEAHAVELWEQMLHTLSHRGISKDAYLRISGKTEAELLAEARPDAERGLRREAVLAAVVEAEGIEPSDDEVLEALQGAAAQEGIKPEKLLQRLRSANRLEPARRDLAQRKALDLLVESAQVADAAPAKAKRGKKAAGAAGDDAA